MLKIAESYCFIITRRTDLLCKWAGHLQKEFLKNKKPELIWYSNQFWLSQSIMIVYPWLAMATAQKISCLALIFLLFLWDSRKGMTRTVTIRMIRTMQRGYNSLLGGGSCGEAELLASAYRSSLRVTMEHGIRRIAFPSISTGVYGYPVEKAAKVAVQTVMKFVQEHPGEIDVVRFVLFDRNTLRVYEAAVEGLKY